MKIGKYHMNVYSPKNREKYNGRYPIITRSRWETKLMCWLDNNPNVLYWSSESIAIGYYNPVKQRMARYFPDFIADIKNKEGKVIRWLIEVKPYGQTIPPVPKLGQRTSTRLWNEAAYAINKAKWEAAEKFCSTNGLTFKLITEKELFGKK